MKFLLPLYLSKSLFIFDSLTQPSSGRVVLDGFLQEVQLLLTLDYLWTQGSFLSRFDEKIT